VNRTIGTLAIIFLIQFAMAAALYWPTQENVGRAEEQPLLNFDPDLIDEIYIEDEMGNEAVLLKMSNQWLLPDLSGMPIDTAKLTKLIDSFGDKAAQWPIATTDASRQRFQVAAYLYQRRLTLIGGGEFLAKIYLGTSPGFRTVHARNDTASPIYRLTLNSYDAPARAGQWLDRQLLQIDEPIRIRSGAYVLSNHSGGWTSAGTGPDSHAPDSRELATLLLGLSGLQVGGIADQDMQRTLSIAAPETTLEIETANGVITLLIYTIGDKHFIRSDKYEYYFTLSALDYGRLASIHALALIDTL
jgi:Domain of unknown function (DUF4340)